MHRGKTSRVFWWTEGRRMYFTIDLQRWGFSVRFPSDWEIQFLCFEIGKR